MAFLKAKDRKKVIRCKLHKCLKFAKIKIKTAHERDVTTQVPSIEYYFVTIFASIAKNTTKTNWNSTIIGGSYPPLKKCEPYRVIC